MDYSPWSSKNLIDRNRLKKFMQVGIDVKFMYTDFGGCVLSGFGDIVYFKAWTTVILFCPLDNDVKAERSSSYAVKET